MATCNRTGLLAVAAASSVATVYFAHPLLATMAADLALSPAVAGLIVTITQVGYGLGLLFVVPLGDRLDRRRLVVLQAALLAVALLAVGTAADAVVLLAGMVAVGLMAVVTQGMVAFAAALAEPKRRGRAVGAVTGGVVLGILLARTVSGLLADLAGWRTVYLVAAAVTATLALVLHRALPSGRPAEVVRTSTLELFRSERLFRSRGLVALLVFAAFSALWSCVALPLTEMSLSHGQIGAFGLAGAAGALVAVPAGRLYDRGRAQVTTGIGLALLLLSWLPLAFTRNSLWALVIGAVLLDLAVQAVHVTSQSMIYPLRQAAGNRLIGGYMVFYSIGSAAGAIISTAVYSAAGWLGVCLLGTAFSAAALVVWLIQQRRRRHESVWSACGQAPDKS